jgi:hypothetical protein
VDELLHQGAFEIRYRLGAAADRHGRGSAAGGLVSTRLEETRNAMRELGLDETVKIKSQ